MTLTHIQTFITFQTLSTFKLGLSLQRFPLQKAFPEASSMHPGSILYSLPPLLPPHGKRQDYPGRNLPNKILLRSSYLEPYWVGYFPEPLSLEMRKTISHLNQIFPEQRSLFGDCLYPHHCRNNGQAES